MQKIACITMLLLGVVNMSMGQNKSQPIHIKFSNQKKWTAILHQAKSEKKVIFVDAFTSWCAPCKVLKNTVFTDPKVAAYFNQHFINCTFDMEKGEGVQLSNEWNVTAYPTLLFFDKDGKIIKQYVGLLQAKDLLHLGEDIANKNP